MKRTFAVFSSLFLGSAIGLGVILYMNRTRGAKTIEPETVSPYVHDTASASETETLLTGGSKPVVLLLYATWCHHCKVMMNAFHQAADSFRGADWVRAEGSVAGNLTKRPDVRGFPTVFGIKTNGDIVIHNGGRDSKSLRSFAETL